MRKGYPSVVTVDGLNYGFESADEMRAFLREYDEIHRKERIEQGKKAMEGIYRFRSEILERTGGKGIQLDDVDSAWREAKDH